MGSKFDEWFTAQHGLRSNTRTSDKELRDRIEAGAAARIEIQRRQLWDQRRTSALYAWQIKDADKKD